MRYISLILRISLLIIWIKMMYLSNWTFSTVSFCGWIGLVIVSIYLSLQSFFWTKVMICPFSHLNNLIDNKNNK